MDNEVKHPVSPEPLRILLVEDDESHAEIVRRAFERFAASFSLIFTSTMAEARDAIQTRAFDLIIADWRLPDGEGIELLNAAPSFPLLIMTSQGNEQMVVEAMRLGALDYVVKSDRALMDMPQIAQRAIRLSRNLVARKLAEQELLKAQETRLLADAMPQIVWSARPDGYVDYYNRRWYEFTGLTRGLGEDSWKSVLHPEDLERSLDLWNAAVDSGQPYEIQYRFWDRKTQSYRWHLARALSVRDDAGHVVKWIGTCTDIDDHKRLSEELESRVAARTEELKNSLLDKTTLLKEVHHRVKNNLQVICSLLSLQLARSDIALAGPLREAHHRVLAMSMVHEHIYESDTLSRLNFGEYVKSLAKYLFDAYLIDRSRIQLELTIEPVHLLLDAAVTCGIILNELVSNSLKHAFGEGLSGKIHIRLRRIEPDRIELAVMDNGVGLPVNFRIEDTTSLGLKVVRALAEQLNGTLKMSEGPGAVISLELNVTGSQVAQVVGSKG